MLIQCALRLCRNTFEGCAPNGTVKKYCSPVCKNRAGVRNNRLRQKRRSLEYKGNKCSKCGYDRCSTALVFHHTDAETKSFGIANHFNQSWETLKKELDKCILLCSNCHLELHDEMVGLERVELSLNG